MKTLKFCCAALIAVACIACKSNKNSEPQENEEFLHLTPVTLEKILSYYNFDSEEFDKTACIKYFKECGFKITEDTTYYSDYEDDLVSYSLEATRYINRTAIEYDEQGKFDYPVDTIEESEFHIYWYNRTTTRSAYIAISRMENENENVYKEIYYTNSIVRECVYSNADILNAFKQDYDFFMSQRKREPTEQSFSIGWRKGSSEDGNYEYTDKDYNTYEDFITAVNSYSFSNNTNHEFTFDNYGSERIEASIEYNKEGSQEYFSIYANLSAIGASGYGYSYRHFGS